MLVSMTGFGQGKSEFQDKRLTVQIRSLNGKQADINVKCPSVYREKELDMRALVSNELTRGKIEINIGIESMNGLGEYTLDEQSFKKYFEVLDNLAKETGIDRGDLLSTLVKLPDVVKQDKESLSEEEWNVLLETIKKAITELREFRITEGKKLHEDIQNRVNHIANAIEEISKLEQGRMDRIKDRIKSNLDQLESTSVNEDRFEQELIYYLEKLDITEEKVRLSAHCNYFLEIMKDGRGQGKKLGFISQEMGREINTIGSKANDADIQKHVVGMKDELEKIKEQLLNVL